MCFIPQRFVKNECFKSPPFEAYYYHLACINFMIAEIKNKYILSLPTLKLLLNKAIPERYLGL